MQHVLAMWSWPSVSAALPFLLQEESAQMYLYLYQTSVWATLPFLPQDESAQISHQLVVTSDTLDLVNHQRRHTLTDQLFCPEAKLVHIESLVQISKAWDEMVQRAFFCWLESAPSLYRWPGRWSCLVSRVVKFVASFVTTCCLTNARLLQRYIMFNWVSPTNLVSFSILLSPVRVLSEQGKTRHLKCFLRCLHELSICYPQSIIDFNAQIKTRVGEFHVHGNVLPDKCLNAKCFLRCFQVSAARRRRRAVSCNWVLGSCNCATVSICVLGSRLQVGSRS